MELKDKKNEQEMKIYQEKTLYYFNSKIKQFPPDVNPNEFLEENLNWKDLIH